MCQFQGTRVADNVGPHVREERQKQGPREADGIPVASPGSIRMRPFRLALRTEQAMHVGDGDKNADMAEAAIQVADEIRCYLDDLYQQQQLRNADTNGAMANVVLAGLTMVWLEAVHSAWNTAMGESALSLLRLLRPKKREDRLNLRRAGRDFLRRSGLWIRRTK